MSTRIDTGFLALSEKEKQTLRLIVRGHDAKSIARSLDLSVHTINERLRDARRKLSVSSSREAARLLLAEEGGAASSSPDLFGDTGIGADSSGLTMDQGGAPAIGAGRAFRRPGILIGVTLMTLLLGLLALTTLPHGASTTPAATHVAPDPVVVDTARQWLVLLDQSRWADSYAAAGTQFRTQNTVQMWTDASEQVRVPLGAMLSRTFLSQDDVAAPPHGYQVVKFRTRFAAKEAVEAVTLEREGDAWRVVGVTIG